MIEKEKTDKIERQSFYLPELDILRFFAFFAVFIHHSFPLNAESYQGKLAPFSQWIAATVSAGGFGVDLFFALSSYLITELLIREYEKTNRIHASAFYIRRALRILPLYYFFVLSAIFISPYFLKDESLNFPHTLGFLTVFANWTCAFFGYPHSIAAPLWSISIEEQFYIIFPFLVMLFGVSRLKTLAFIFLGIALVSRLLLVILEVPHPGIWCNTFARLDPIAGGILLALSMRHRFLEPITNNFKRISLIIFALFLYILAARYFEPAGPTSITLFSITAVASVLIIWAIITPRGINSKKYTVLIYLGRISYGLYVFHMLGIKLADVILENSSITGSMLTFGRAGIALTTTIILSIISYNLLEKPFLKLKKRFTFVESRPT